MYVIVDTNVLVVANGKTPQASQQCVMNCSQNLREIQQGKILVLDDRWLIIKEYLKNVSSSGQPGVGDAFLKWVLTNKGNLKHCQLVPITEVSENNFSEFPKDAELKDFDPSDRKFVAVALAHLEKPPILNAVDSDWKNFEDRLAVYGIKVEFICPDSFSQTKVQNSK